MTEEKAKPKNKKEFLGFAEEELAVEISEHPEDDPEFPDEVPTSPELRVQIQKNVTTSRRTVEMASSILQTLEKRSTHPPKL